VTARGPRRRAVVVLAAAVAAALLSAGCGASSPAALTRTAKAHTAPARAGDTVLMVTEKEYSITVSASTIRPGTYTVEVSNHGKMSHNLNIKGPGVSNWRSPTVSPNTTANVGVTLRAGQYELGCSIDHHKALGMDTKIQVT
jgi:plastocyanin